MLCGRVIVTVPHISIIQNIHNTVYLPNVLILIINNPLHNCNCRNNRFRIFGRFHRVNPSRKLPLLVCWLEFPLHFCESRRQYTPNSMKCYVSFCEYDLVECPLMIHPLRYFSFHDWCNKIRGRCYPVWEVTYNRTLAVIGNSRPCTGGSVFPLSVIYHILFFIK